MLVVCFTCSKKDKKNNKKYQTTFSQNQEIF